MSKTAHSLVGLKLDGYTVQRLTEVYRVDDDGRKSQTIGYFKDGKVAAAWAQGQTDANWHKTSEVLAIANELGELYYLFEGQEITVNSDKQAALEVRTKALAKLSPEERSVLGL